MKFPTIVDALEHHAAHAPDSPAITLRSDDATKRTTFAELDRQATAIAAELEARGLTGERVVLFFPFGLEFVAALLACFKARVVGVGAYPPRVGREDSRADHVLAASQPAAVLSASAFRQTLAARRAADGRLWSCPWIDVDLVDLERADGYRREPVHEESTAFIQFTSGSTSDPKGVVLTHANIAHNQHNTTTKAGLDERTVIVSWLPLYHDMGLFGQVLLGIWTGGETVLLSPFAVIQRPRRWLEAISEHRATASGGPNFAYDLCVDRISDDELEGLDLSTWKIAFNGAEPVWARTLERFGDRFASCGFRSSSFFPCYGMAEATLFVTGGPSGRGYETRLAPAEGAGPRRVVGCGTSVIEKIAIVDPDRRTRMPERSIGEIWISGPNVARGYWRASAEDEARFGARVAGDAGTRRYFRTGDLGFLEDGQLYVVGRIKDLIIIAGRNYHPHDVERASQEAATELRRGGAAAFSVNADGSERLVVLQELERARAASDPERLVRAARRAIARELELEVQAYVLLRPMSLPKTTSGKIRRRRCRELFLGGGFEPVHAWCQTERLTCAPAAGGRS